MNKRKLFLFLTAAIMLALTACDGSFSDPGMNDAAVGGSSGGTTGGGGGGGGLSGTYRYDRGVLGSAEITFRGSNFTEKGSVFGTSFSKSGTYTVTGDTIICITTTSSDPSEIGETQYFTIIDATQIRDEEKWNTWTKK
jgi:hypothetical protein